MIGRGSGAMGRRARAAVSRCLVAGLATATLAFTVGRPAVASLSEPDRQLVSRIETYLNGIRTLKARFIQAEKNGWIAEGSIYIARPGRLRIEYAPPHRFLVVSTGRLLILYNGRSDQVTHLPTGVSPAAFLLEPRIDLSRNVDIQRVQRGRETVTLTVKPRKGDTATQLRLVFNRHPFNIKEWTVIDKNRKETRIILIDKQIGVPIPRAKFLFSKPARSAQQARSGRPDKVTEKPLQSR